MRICSEFIVSVFKDRRTTSYNIFLGSEPAVFLREEEIYFILFPKMHKSHSFKQRHLSVALLPQFRKRKKTYLQFSKATRNAVPFEKPESAIICFPLFRVSTTRQCIVKAEHTTIILYASSDGHLFLFIYLFGTKTYDFENCLFQPAQFTSLSKPHASKPSTDIIHRYSLKL